MLFPILTQHRILCPVGVLESPEAFAVRDADYQLAVFECLSNFELFFHVVHLGLIKSKIRVAVNALVRINFAIIDKAIPERQARQLFVCGYYFD